MEKKHIFLVDFDDTLVSTTDFLVKIYNQITTDQVDIKDFIEMETWRLVPRYGSMFSEIVKAIVDDPTCIPPITGAKEFLEYLFAKEDAQIIILTKRSIGQVIYDYLQNVISPFNWDEDKIRVVFVEKSAQKAILEKRIDRDKYHLHLFEDRLPVHEAFSYLDSAWMWKRPWNDTNVFKYKGNGGAKFHTYTDFHEVILKLYKNDYYNKSEKNPDIILPGM